MPLQIVSSLCGQSRMYSTGSYVTVALQDCFEEQHEWDLQVAGLLQIATDMTYQ